MTMNFAKRTVKMLSSEEEKILFEQWREARDAKNHIVEDKLFEKITTQFNPIVLNLVYKMKGYKLDHDEMVSEAFIGLVKAATTFDPQKGFRFGTYASNCVRNTLYSFITKQYFMTNVCSNHERRTVFFNLRKQMARQMKNDKNNELTFERVKELSESMNVDVEIIEIMHALINDPYQSLNQLAFQNSASEEDSQTYQDFLVSEEDTQDIDLEQKQLRVLQTQIIDKALDKLDHRSRVIMEKSVLVEKDEKYTLDELGEILNISKERVRQIRNIATDKIQQYIKRDLIDRGIPISDVLSAR